MVGLQQYRVYTVTMIIAGKVFLKKGLQSIMLIAFSQADIVDVQFI